MEHPLELCESHHQQNFSSILVRIQAMQSNADVLPLPHTNFPQMPMNVHQLREFGYSRATTSTPMSASIAPSAPSTSGHSSHSHLKTAPRKAIARGAAKKKLPFGDQRFLHKSFYNDQRWLSPFVSKVKKDFTDALANEKPDSYNPVWPAEVVMAEMNELCRFLAQQYYSRRGSGMSCHHDKMCLMIVCGGFLMALQGKIGSKHQMENIISLPHSKWENPKKSEKSKYKFVAEVAERWLGVGMYCDRNKFLEDVKKCRPYDLNSNSGRKITNSWNQMNPTLPNHLERPFNCDDNTKVSGQMHIVHILVYKTFFPDYPGYQGLERSYAQKMSDDKALATQKEEQTKKKTEAEAKKRQEQEEAAAAVDEQAEEEEEAEEQEEKEEEVVYEQSDEEADRPVGEDDDSSESSSSSNEYGR
jgi:hypothetical protein